jgi:hypothetical protein
MASATLPVQRDGRVWRKSPGAGQNVEPRLLVAQIHEGGPTWSGWARKRQDEQSCLRGTRGRYVAGSYRAACAHPREKDFS